MVRKAGVNVVVVNVLGHRIIIRSNGIKGDKLVRMRHTQNKTKTKTKQKKKKIKEEERQKERKKQITKTGM